MQTRNALRVALNTIQATGITAGQLSRRTGLSLPTCRKILSDRSGARGYHWSTIEFALEKIGCELVIVTKPSGSRAVTNVGYARRRLSGRWSVG